MPENMFLFNISNFAGREKLIGQLADVDEDIMNSVLEDIPLSDIPSDMIHSAVRNATLKHNMIPVLCDSSYKNKGVQPLLDAVVAYLPSPTDVDHEFMKHYGDSLCALAFKIMQVPQLGVLTFLRAYGGSLKTGANIYNVNREITEKVSRVYNVFADDFKEIKEITAGNIVAVSGLKEVSWFNLNM